MALLAGVLVGLSFLSKPNIGGLLLAVLVLVLVVARVPRLTALSRLCVVWNAAPTTERNIVTHIDPTPEQLAAFAGADLATPVVMLNLNRYRDRAQYDAPGPDDDLSGREAYLRYGGVALRAMAEVGAQILWMAPAEQVFAGCEHDTYDEALAVWYPNRGAFLEMLALDWYREALVHRRAALEHATIIAMTGPSTPELTRPGAAA